MTPRLGLYKQMRFQHPIRTLRFSKTQSGEHLGKLLSPYLESVMAFRFGIIRAVDDMIYEVGYIARHGQTIKYEKDLSRES